ncbi:MAG: B12-binding domain-containing radical SAM protein [Phycisphaerales bacterium]|nr:MAG: B12-binding domain-containing radical SAM protein [Phycisphaerales bacterium]
MARIALCQDLMVECMGLMSISAVLKEAGHVVEVFIDEQTDERRFLAELASFEPDIVGFSILTPSVPWALETGRRVKETIGAVTVYGNVHAIVCPQIIDQPGVDIVCRGEGERPMLELAACVDRGEPYTHIRSFWAKTAEGIVKNPLPDEMLDLNTLPFHDRSLYDKYRFFRNSKYLFMLAGRGCPFRCSFCTNPVLLEHYGGKKYLRRRSPELVIRELEFHLQRRDVRYVSFIDEVFWVKNDWLREFLTLYKQRIRVPFYAEYRFGGGITEDDIRLMAEAGAENLVISAETGDESQRRKLMNKSVGDDHILQITRWLRKHKISYVTSAFFGLPGDTVQDHVDRLGFFRKIRPTYLWTTFFQPYPGVSLAEHPSVKRFVPAKKPFEATLHHDMYLDLPDRDRLVNLKKVYYLCMLSPGLTPVLVWLTKSRIPLLFDLLFMAHFSYYVFKFERITARQLLTHVKIFAVNPALRKTRFLRNRERWSAMLQRTIGDRRIAAADPEMNEAKYGDTVAPV